jgi:hypothetical protein
MEVHGQLRFPGTLPPGKGRPVRIGWAPEPVWKLWRKENSWPYRNSKSDLSVFQPVASCYTDWAIPALKTLSNPRRRECGSWRKFNDFSVCQNIAIKCSALFIHEPQFMIVLSAHIPRYVNFAVDSKQRLNGGFLCTETNLSSRIIWN